MDNGEYVQKKRKKYFHSFEFFLFMILIEKHSLFDKALLLWCM